MLDLQKIAKGGVSAVWGLLGVIAGSWATGHHQQIERRNGRIKDQLTEFYAPLRGMRADIKAKSDLRVKINAIARNEWPTKFDGVHDPDVKKKISESNWQGYERLIDYSDEQLRTEIVPTYREMVGHFKSHMAYAEESTIEHYAAFVEFVEIWNRFLANSLPREVAEKLSHAEKNLYPLYDDIEENAKRLSGKLKNESWLRRKLMWWSNN
jgi:hypothetical protein